jgi:RNA-directed DNA polymerase
VCAGGADRHDFAYTRYADDLTFSGNDPAQVGKVVGLVPRIIAAEGFIVNAAKTRIFRQGGRQAVTGVIVNRTLGLSRQERRKLRAALHQQKSAADAASAGEAARLRGKLAYVFMLNRTQAAALGWRSPEVG